MKTALVITGETQQVILSPENDVDKQVITAMKGKEGLNGSIELKIGSFWEDCNYGNFHTYKSSVLQRCQGGWIREFASADSLIIILTKKELTQPPEGTERE